MTDRGGRPVNLYPGQGTLPLQLDLRDGFEGRQRALGQRQLLFGIPLDELGDFVSNLLHYSDLDYRPAQIQVGMLLRAKS